MQVTPLELGLAAAAVAVIFGPKRLPSFKRSSDVNVVDLTALAPSQPAAGRAPSPLQSSPARAAAPSAAPPAPIAQPQKQYAMSGPTSPQPLKLPNEL